MPDELSIKQPRIPEAVEGIQVNFCKNPQCPNFGVPASTEKQPRGVGPGDQDRDNYIVVGGKRSEKGASAPRLQCKLCGEQPPIKSNRAISEEIARFSAYLSRETSSCPNETCHNHWIDIGAGKTAYHSFGKTRSGSQRYRCKLCNTTFAIGKATTGQKKPHINLLVFRLLMNKMPFRRICETAGIGMPALYGKIEFLQQQCLSFAGNREQKLCDGMAIKRLYLGVDRQDYMVNWIRASDKRNVRLHAVGAADNGTGYVFGLHLNFDPAMDAVQIEQDAKDLGEYEVKNPFRKYARLWLKEDYYESIQRNLRQKRPIHHSSLITEAESVYEQAVGREDEEVSEEQDLHTALPRKGTQIHSEYTLYGHFFLLKKMFGGVEKVRFFLDQDSGMRAACLSAFAEEIKKGRCDAFYVKINRDLTINQKRQALAESRKEFERVMKKYPDMRESAVKLTLIKERLKKVVSLGKWQDRWVYHPFPNMSEPEKAMCYLTDTGKYDEDHLAWLYNKASLHAIDRFFMQVRRRLSLLERPIATPSSAGRKWHGYNAYNPAVIIKLLDIFRVFYNYVEVGKDKDTPAMRLGLAKGKVNMDDIIYYSR